MSEPRPQTSQYLLLFHGIDWHKDLPAQELQTTMTNWYAWFDGLVKDGRCQGGQPLGPEGKVVSGKKGTAISDGPFAEAKEAVGGYFLLNVSSEEEAVEIAKQCPALEHGLQVEVRPVVPVCPAGSEANVSYDYAQA